MRSPKKVNAKRRPHPEQMTCRHCGHVEWVPVMPPPEIIGNPHPSVGNEAPKGTSLMVPSAYRIDYKCGRCGRDTWVERTVPIEGEKAENQEVLDFARKLLELKEPEKMALYALEHLQKIKTGKDLATAKSNGSLARLKRWGLWPKDHRQAKVLVGVLIIALQVLRGCEWKGTKEQKEHVANTITNIYINGSLVDPTTRPVHDVNQK